LQQPPVRDVLQVLAHVDERQARYARPDEVLGELGLALDGFGEHVPDLLGHLVVEEVGLFAASGFDDVERERHVHRLVAEHPVRAGGQAVEQAARTQEVDVGEGAVEEQAFDARGETDQVEQELPAVGPGFEAVQVAERVDPAEAELGLPRDRRDVLDGGERLEALVLVGDVGVQEVQVELDVHGLLEQLPGEVEPPFG